VRNLLVLGLVLSGCASSSVAPQLDGGGGGHAICPDHPDQCGGMCCGNKCVDTMLDPLNCGSCTNTCMNGELCKGGACGCQPSGTACGTGQSCCGSTGCKSLDSDAFNCGKCGNACPAGQVCASGTCGCPAGGCVAYDMSMSMSSVDMAMSGGGGVCQCSNHCTSDPIGWCVGPNCCYFDGIAGACNIGPCSPNMTP
jgi:hypothetical protein